MTDVRLGEQFNLEAVTMDWLLHPVTFELDDREELATAVRVALGTDALSDVNEIRPDPDSDDRRGWWGDLEAEAIWEGWPIGCKNWLLTRAKITQAPSQEGSTLLRARTYTQEALQPFIDKRISSRIDVSAIRTELQRIEVTATIYRGPLAEIDLRYQILWEDDQEFVSEKVRRNSVISSPNKNLVLSTFQPLISLLQITSPRRDLLLSSAAPQVSRSNSIPNSLRDWPIPFIDRRMKVNVGFTSSTRFWAPSQPYVLRKGMTNLRYERTQVNVGFVNRMKLP